MRKRQSTAHLTRRGFLYLAGGLTVASALAACGDGDSDEAGSAAEATSGPWEYTDDRGKKISRPTRPTRVVAYVSSAAALWDFGFEVVGAFGPQKTESGGKELQAGNMDLSKVESVGNAWDDFNVEKLAALRPDLVVTGMTGEGDDSMWVFTEPDLIAKVEQVAPILAISEFKLAQPAVIERYAKLATSLGADTGAGAVKTAKDDFQKASDELKQAAQEKGGLKIMAMSADKDGIYVAKPEFFADLAYYRELGLDLVSGGGSDDYWETLSWEQVAKYPADLILTDSRTYSLSRQQLDEFPTWKQLPAVKAGQLGDWSAEPRFNYQLATPVIRELTESVRSARTDVVA